MLFRSDFDQLLWPGGRAFELSCCLGVGIFEFLFLPVTTNHFLGWGISVIFDLTFLPRVGNLTAIFGKNSKSCPMSHRLDIDRCSTVDILCKYITHCSVTTPGRVPQGEGNLG